MRTDQLVYTRDYIENAIAEAQECLNINKYVCPEVYSAIHYLMQAQTEIERAMANCK